MLPFQSTSYVALPSPLAEPTSWNTFGYEAAMPDAANSLLRRPGEEEPSIRDLMEEINPDNHKPESYLKFLPQRLLKRSDIAFYHIVLTARLLSYKCHGGLRLEAKADLAVSNALSKLLACSGLRLPVPLDIHHLIISLHMIGLRLTDVFQTRGYGLQQGDFLVTRDDLADKEEYFQRILKLMSFEFKTKITKMMHSYKVTRRTLGFGALSLVGFFKIPQAMMEVTMDQVVAARGWMMEWDRELTGMAPKRNETIEEYARRLQESSSVKKTKTNKGPKKRPRSHRMLLR